MKLSFPQTSRVHQRGLGLADAIFVLALIALLAGVLIPAYFQRQKDLQQEFVQEGLKHLVVLQSRYALGRNPVAYAARFSELSPLNDEDRFDALFSGEFSGYEFDLGARQPEPIPRFMLDQNLLLVQVADYNFAWFVKSYPERPYNRILAERLERHIGKTHRSSGSSLMTAMNTMMQSTLLDMNAVAQDRGTDGNATVAMPVTRAEPDANFILMAFADLNTTVVLGAIEEMMSGLGMDAVGSEGADAEAGADDAAAEIGPDDTANEMVEELRRTLPQVIAELQDTAPLGDRLDLNTAYVGEATWSAAAKPLNYGITGSMSYYIDKSGVLRGEDVEGNFGDFGMAKLEAAQ